jgi:hypothetical protein
MATTSNREYHGFRGPYSGSSKTPNLTVEFENPQGNLVPRFVLQVGFSESYEDLVRDAAMCLEGREDVFVLALAKFEESPLYRCPVRDLEFSMFRL